jgi:hypothetical protein
MHIYCVVLSTVAMCCGPGLDIQYLKLTAACKHKFQNQFTMDVLVINTQSHTEYRSCDEFLHPKTVSMLDVLV